jgi:hypothetical protein
MGLEVGVGSSLVAWRPIPSCHMWGIWLEETGWLLTVEKSMGEIKWNTLKSFLQMGLSQLFILASQFLFFDFIDALKFRS